MITIDRMKALEANSEWRGVSSRLLMENAGYSVVEEIGKHWQLEEKAAVFAGTGNNGGDGFVAARRLVNRGIHVKLVLLGRPRNIASEDAEKNWNIIAQMDEDIDFEIIRDSSEINELDLESEVIIDAVLGTGISGELREPVSSAVEYINSQDSYKVAVDVPTGLDPGNGKVHDKAVKCDLTVTFHDLKPGLEHSDEEYVGDIVKADIGIPKSAERRAGPGDVLMSIPPREIGSHKGKNGKILIIGGGSQYSGAPALTALSSLNAGVDLATVAAPKETANIINTFSPNLITQEFLGENLNPEALPKIIESLPDNDAVLLGPGLGKSKETEEAVIELLHELVENHSDMPVLLDADGLKIAGDEEEALQNSNYVVTPHSGEFRHLSDTSLPKDHQDRGDIVSQVAEAFGITIMLKGSIDICASPDGGVVYNDTGNPGMTVGGTGDVLAGVTGAFLSRGAHPFRAGCAGLFLNGLSGDLCKENKGYEFLATDVKDKIPLAISKARKHW